MGARLAVLLLTSVGQGRPGVILPGEHFREYF